MAEPIEQVMEVIEAFLIEWNRGGELIVHDAARFQPLLDNPQTRSITVSVLANVLAYFTNMLTVDDIHAICDQARERWLDA